MKISVIGAGAVGATLAQRILESGIADVALVDVAGRIARGKAFDLLDASAVIGHEKDITGTDDYRAMESSDIVVITAGFPRKPGMTREELVSKNAGIVKDVSDKIKKYAPSAIVIVVTNPLDVMTYIACKTTSFKRECVFGMAGVLDGSRLRQLIAAELKVPRLAVETYVIGSHGDTMVPVISHTRVSGKPVTELMSEERLAAIIKRTRDRGAEIVNLFGSGSAYYSPSASVFKMIRAIIDNSGETLVVSAYLKGEYGLNDICIGVPCVLGRGGIEKIVKLDLSSDEKAAFAKSAETIKNSLPS